MLVKRCSGHVRLELRRGVGEVRLGLRGGVGEEQLAGGGVAEPAAAASSKSVNV